MTGVQTCALPISGQTATLTAGGANSYTWSGGQTTASISVSPTVTATYSVTGVVGAGCSGTAATTVTVNDLPVVTASSSVPGDSICVGEPITLNGSGAITYTWSGGVSDGVSFSPTATQAYTVTGTDANTCSNTAIIIITVDACLGFEHSQATDNVVIYPNPATESVMVRCASGNEKKQIMIYDIAGRLIYLVETTKTEQKIPVGNFSTGHYWIKVISPKIYYSARLEIQN